MKRISRWWQLVMATFVLSTTGSAARVDQDVALGERLKSCTPSVAVAAAKQIISDTKSLSEPLGLFAPAAVLFHHDNKDEGVFWFYVAQLRTRQQFAFQPSDRQQLLAVMLMSFGPPINNYALQDVANLDRILARVLEWDSANPFQPAARTDAIDARLESIYTGLGSLRAKLVVEGEALQQQARQAAADIEETYQKAEAERCRSRPTS